MNFRIYLVVITTILFFQETSTQDELFPNNRPEGVSGQTFYLDQPSSCRSTSSYSVTGKTTIIGPSSESGSTIQKECVITLASFAQKPMKFQLQIPQMRLNCDLQFYIYDGDSTSTLLKSYDCHKGNDNAYNPIFTTGSKVSFKLVRTRIDTNANYEIRIIAETVQAVITGGDGWNSRLDRDQNTVRKFDTDIVIILMCCAFLFAFLVYGIVLCIYWRRRDKDNKKWTERPMAYDNPGLTPTNSTLAYVEQVKAHPPDDPRMQPMSDFTKTNGRQSHTYQTRMAQSSIDADSVFEGEKGEKLRRRHESNNGQLRNGSYNNQAYQQTPVKSRARLSHRNAISTYPNKESSSPAGSDIPSLSQENHLWKPKPRKQVEQDLTSSDSEDKVEHASIGLNTDPEMTDHGVQCEADTEFEDPPLKASSNLTSTGVGSSPVLNAQRQSPQPQKYHRPPSYEEALSETEYPSFKPDQPRSSPKPQQQPGMTYVPYSDPNLRRPQPVYSPNSGRHPYSPDYAHSNPLPNLENNHSIPIYSYLVNRGYNIDDGQSSCGATSHHSDSRMGHTDDSDFPANLDCGVEFMSR